MTEPVERILGKLQGVKSQGSYWIAKCPGHPDKKQSLSVKVGNDGRALLNCFAGCTFATIIGALGIPASETFATPLKVETGGADPRKVHDLGKPVCSYKYTDADGTLLYKVVRYDPKDFRPWRIVNGQWKMGLGDVKPVLYHLPEVIEAVSLGKRIYLCEGEKDADNLRVAGWCATTNSGGAKKWEQSFTDVLAGGDIVIFEDNDPAGVERSAQLAPILKAAGCTVRVVKLKGLPPKGDVSDWFEMGGDIADLDTEVNNVTPFGEDPLHRNIWCLTDLLKNESIMRPPPPIVPRLAWAGRSTLLAAREKSGKSTLIGYVAAKVSRGQHFLDDPCAYGDVLIVSLEENPGDTARRLRHFGADGSKVHILTHFKGSARERAKELGEAIDDLAPLLVIVDTLAAYSDGQIQDDNNATQMTAVLQPLSSLAHNKGVALMVVHHARKSDGKSRGSTAITAATDVVCEFWPPDEDQDPTLRRMSSRGRVPLVRQYDMRFSGDTYHLVTNEEAPLEDRIIATVMNRPGINITDLSDAVRTRKETVSRAVMDMLAKGALKNSSENMTRPRLVVPGHAQPGFIA